MEPLPCTRDAIADVVAAARSVDGHPPLSAHKHRVIDGAAAGRFRCWGVAGRASIVAVAAQHSHGDDEHWAIEVAVAPRARGDEAAAISLAAAMLPGDETHTLWAFREEQQQAAGTLGYETFRDLLLMQTPLPAAPPAPVAGYRMRAFMVGADEATVAAVNNRAFAGHRENAAMTAGAVRAGEREPWFDEEGFLVVVAEPDTVAGFCWTKVHPEGRGEIYIIGVDPDHHGRGVGRWLLLAGLHHLHQRGCAVGSLWTDADNPAIARLYRGVGFETTLVNSEMRPPPRR